MKKKRKMGAGKKETSNQQGKAKQYSKALLAHEALKETRRRKKTFCLGDLECTPQNAWLPLYKPEKIPGFPGVFIPCKLE